MSNAQLNFLRLFLHSIRRDSRIAEIRILFISLLIGVTASTAVGFFTHRVENSFNHQVSELIASDLIVSSKEIINNKIKQQAIDTQLSIAETTHLISAAISHSGLQLAEVKGVSSTYPLRGTLRLFNDNDKEIEVNTLPQSGEAWVEPQLLYALNLKQGERFQLGSKTFMIAGILAYEPDRGGDLFQTAPRILINQTDLQATQLITPLSRVSYHLLLSGKDQDIQAFQQWITDKLQPGQNIKTAEDARPEIRIAIQKAREFLNLAALVSILIAGVAIAIATISFVQKEIQHSAILRALGATSKFINRLYIARLISLGLISSILGVILGWLAQQGLVYFLGSFYTSHIAQAEFYPAWLGLLTGMIMLFGFALSPLLRLKQVPPIRVLRQEVYIKPTPYWQMLLGALLALIILLIWQLGSIKLIFIMIASLIIVLGIIFLFARALVYLAKFFNYNKNLALYYGLSNLQRQPNLTALQLSALSLGFLLLFLLTIIRVDLLNTWQNNLPEETPNIFIINIQKQQINDIENYFLENNLGEFTLYPVIRARLIEINATPIHPEDYAEERIQSILNRDFNLSYGKDYAQDNEIIAGHWWQENEYNQALVSIEEELANDLNIQIGDTVKFLIADQEQVLTIASIRRITWESFNVNFFFIGTDSLKDFPALYLGNFYLSTQQKALLTDLTKKYPNITPVDITQIMKQVFNIMNKASLAIEYVFGFTLLSGLMVLFAALRASFHQRQYESAILRVFGAKKAMINKSLLVEFGLLGSLAGLLAALFASVIGWILAIYLFDLPYYFHNMLWLWGIIGGGVLISIAGFLASRSVLNTPPKQFLQKL